ncbi:hypothetical protein [Woodsholea maritima]|uniref:hypothetical protein n=1 Tax=Woodsholea maritima TaxID=240237 RepID=UPI0003779790|nr:hypothetical protein [Woodsholea maritima]
MMMSSRAEFALRDPGALSALLIYDWRMRQLLTDDEVLGDRAQAGALEGEASISVLRHLQRLRWITAMHGVRPHGGRMRLWPLDEIFKVQIVLDLRALTGARLAACVDAYTTIAPDAVENALADWESYIGMSLKEANGVGQIEGDTRRLVTNPDKLNACAERSVARFIARNDFENVAAPAFLL